MTAGERAAPATALTIAGFDSGGAAGMPADLKTFALLGVYGLGVITAATAQNSVAITALHYLPPEFVAAQLEAVLSDYGAAAIKSGFIGRAELIETIAGVLTRYPVANLVVDPVLVNHKGEAMFTPAVTGAYRRKLFPLARLVTPNRREGELLAGFPIHTLEDGERAVRAIRATGPQAVLLKGIPVGEQVIDLFFDGHTLRRFESPKIETENRHGSGDTLSAATVAFLAQGEETLPAIQRARRFTRRAIQGAIHWRLGQGHGPLNHWH